MTVTLSDDPIAAFKSILTNTKVLNLSTQERWVYSACLAFAANQCSTQFSASLKALTAVTGLRSQTLINCLDTLKLEGLIDCYLELPKATKPRDERGAISELTDIAEIVAKVAQSTQRNWIKLYPDLDWLKRELLHAQNWCIEKRVQHKQPGRFLSSWLARAFESRPRQKLIAFEGRFK